MKLSSTLVRLRAQTFIYPEGSLMGQTLSDIQETLKKHDLLFRECPELSGHRSLEEEFTSLGNQNSIETVQFH